MSRHALLSTRTLESLNSDVLIRILSAFDSFSDLASGLTAVLLHFASNILGPATRDAALLRQTSQLERSSHEEFQRAVDEAVLDYRAHLRVAAAPWVPMLDADTAPLILRRQLLVYIYGGKYSRPLDYPRFFGTVFSLFHTLELERISDMDHFLGHLLFWDTYYAPELKDIAKKMKRMLDSDSYLLDHLCHSGLFDMFKGSHCFTTPSSLNGSQQSAIHMATSHFGVETSTSTEPLAWRDLLWGDETCRWACDLVKAPPSTSVNQQDYEQARSALECWRCFVIVFWDRERA
ncbi:hypothetical protein J3E68DRAFT_439937 [Trichoderma sp. SZMC 28012]